ncbi:hypothetical protein RF11_09127 [Thelohanellus kitauei]|uniref:Alpha-soluble NSF attachment protein n=1 Tax=Thelohanellus kitauei TaxID=669202 RepID=A0A0C2MXN7_THEKT|nr:hypothetical protein RF11_09127 [Thelohanellus kitauei]
MGQAISSFLANGYEVLNNEENELPMSKDKANDEFSKLINIGDKYVKSKQYKDAGVFYYKAAEIGKCYQLERPTVIQRYELAADCFLKINDRCAILCFQNAIDVYQEMGSIQQAIQLCFQYRYKCHQIFQEKTQIKNLYDKADELPYLSHDKIHT